MEAVITLMAFLLTFPLPKHSTESIPKRYEADIVAIFVSESELQLSVESLQAAVVLGVDDANKQYPHIRFNLKLKNDSQTCFNNYAGVLAAEEYYRNRVTAFVGPACSRALDPVGRMASYWNVPIYSAGGIDMLFSMKNIYNTLTRVSFSIDQVTQFILHILMEFQWRHIAILVDESQISETIIRRSLSETIKQTEYTTFPIYKEFNSSQPTNYKQILKDASKNVRVFLLLACGETVRDILLAGYDLGMESGEYAFLSVELLKNQRISKQFNWYKPDDKRNKEARKMYESLMIISIRVPVRDEYQTFINNVKEIAKTKFSTILESSSINPIVGSFYDCVLLYAYSLNKTLSEGGNPKNGQALARQIWNATYPGGYDIRLTGDISINENGDREADYTLNDMDPETGIMTPIATFLGSRQIYDKLDDREIHWPGNGGPPLDVPICGFLGNAPECMPIAMMSALNIILPVLFAVSVVGFVIGVFAYRRIMHEAKLADYWWKIEWSELTFFEGNHMASSLSFSKSHNRSTPTQNQSGRGSTAPVNANGLIALYKGQKVYVKTLEMTKLQVSRTSLMELKLVHEINHDNLLRYVGLCITDPNYAIITDFATRGTLSDMLANHDINIDWMFSCSIITDLTEVRITIGMFCRHISTYSKMHSLKKNSCTILFLVVKKGR